MPVTVPAHWADKLDRETSAPYFGALQRFVSQERQMRAIYPPEDQTFAALAAIAPGDVRVVLLGQDPYHRPGQAHGLSFSVPPGVLQPPSLRNIFRELHSDLGASMPVSGCLAPWAEQGVLLLNSVLTVREGAPGSHARRGWETFTDAILSSLYDAPYTIVFLLWGAYARKKAALIDRRRHVVIESAHPSPLSASTGFFGSRPFSRANEALVAAGEKAIVWELP